MPAAAPHTYHVRIACAGRAPCLRCLAVRHMCMSQRCGRRWKVERRRTQGDEGGVGSGVPYDPFFLPLNTPRSWPVRRLSDSPAPSPAMFALAPSPPPQSPVLRARPYSETSTGRPPSFGNRFIHLPRPRIRAIRVKLRCPAALSSGRRATSRSRTPHSPMYATRLNAVPAPFVSSVLTN
ncbi:hypothetical protein FKP32DRAFT_5647 [Trametes sanguinea]|nr:hypothetical protein FKP32DRAFT_5647 [Trametes sanguinea]